MILGSSVDAYYKKDSIVGTRLNCGYHASLQVFFSFSFFCTNYSMYRCFWAVTVTVTPTVTVEPSIVTFVSLELAFLFFIGEGEKPPLRVCQSGS